MIASDQEQAGSRTDATCHDNVKQHLLDSSFF